jgi:photosystem II stability/assembly factor-like uncharacterized protein
MVPAWQRLTTHEGGTVASLATVPTGLQDGTALFAATAVGLFRSDDAGYGWSPVDIRPLPMVTTVAPSVRFAANRTLFAGTETGLFRTIDGGHTWRCVLNEGAVFSVATVLRDEMEETVFVGTGADGIVRSDNGGQTWSGANAGLLDLTVLTLAFSPNVSHDRTGFAGTASGLYRTRNGGGSWREVPLPCDDSGVQCVAISPEFANDGLVFAGTEADGLLRSDDGGSTWESVPEFSGRGVSAIAFSASFAISHIVAVATADGVALSGDAGDSWLLCGQELPPVLSLAFAFDATTEVLVAGLHGKGAARLAHQSPDAQWEYATRGLHATICTSLIACPACTLLSAGPDIGLRLSLDGGRRWEAVNIGQPGATINAISAVLRTHGNHTVYAATDRGVLRSDDMGRRWIESTHEEAIPTTLVTAALVGDALQPSVVAATLDGHLIKSDDGGTHWRTLSIPFADAHIVSLVCSSNGADSFTLYVGTVCSELSATVWRSTDGGETWLPWLRERGTALTLPMALPPNDPDLVLVGLEGRVLRLRPNAWEMRDGVRTPMWREANIIMNDSGSPAITALAVSPKFHTDGIIFAATSAGVYRSTDRGFTFSAWNEGLGPRPMLAVATISSGYLPEDSFTIFAMSVDGTIWNRRG